MALNPKKGSAVGSVAFRPRLAADLALFVGHHD